MPTIKKTTSAAIESLFADLIHSKPESFAILNMWGTTATAGEVVHVTTGTAGEPLCKDLPLNLESANQVVDTARDQFIFNEEIRPGQIRVEVPAAVADVTVMAHIQTP